MDKKNSILIFGILITISLITGAFYIGHRQGIVVGKGIGKDMYNTGYQQGKEDADSNLAEKNAELTSQYNQLSDNYNSLRNSVIKYIGATTYKSTQHLSCTSMQYGINDQFTSTDCN